MTERCKQFEDSLMELVYDELPEAEADELRMHAAACSACRTQLEGILLTRKLTAALPVDEADGDFDAAVLNAAAETTAQHTRSKNLPAPQRKGHVTPPAPGFWDHFRGLLLRPAFAGSALVVLVGLFTFFIIDNSQTRQHPGSESYATRSPALQLDKAPVPPAPSVTPRDEGAAERADESAVGDAHLRQGIPNSKISSEEKGAKRRVAESLENLSRKKGSSQSMRTGGRGGLSSEPFDTLDDSARSRSRAAGKRTKKEAKSKAAVGSDDALGGSFAKPPPTNTPAGSQWTGGSGAGSTIPSAKKQQWTEGAAEPEALEESGLPSMAGIENESRSEDADRGKATPAKDFDRGMAAFARGDCKSAVIHLERVLLANTSPSKKATAIHHIARCEKRRGRFASAAGWYDQLLSNYPTHPKRPEAMFEAANCRIRLGQTRKARELLESLQKYPGWRDRANRELERLSDK